MINIIKHVIRRVVTTLQIPKLPIEKSGQDEDGYWYVKLKDSWSFYGPKSRSKEKKFYQLLPKRVREKLIFECYEIAWDIAVRYVDGRLKWGGPKKEENYAVKLGDTVAEMGAFRGFYTLYLSEKVGKTGRIIAIEPIPENIQYLKHNIEKNKITNVDIVPKGVWDQDGWQTFNRKSSDFQSGSIDLTYSSNDQLKIEVNSLDTILKTAGANQVDFMLIQLNGAEPEALQGLNHYKPLHLAIAARYNTPDKNAVKVITELLQSRGYEYYIQERHFIYGQLNV